MLFDVIHQGALCYPTPFHGAIDPSLKDCEAWTLFHHGEKLLIHSEGHLSNCSSKFALKSTKVRRTSEYHRAMVSISPFFHLG